MVLFWILLYILSWIIHLSWGIWGMYLVEKIFRIKEFFWKVLVTFICWIMIVIISHGYPFFYLHQYLELKIGWRERITYHYEKSIAYNYFIKPIKDQYNDIKSQLK